MLTDRLAVPLIRPRTAVLSQAKLAASDPGVGIQLIEIRVAATSVPAIAVPADARSPRAGQFHEGRSVRMVSLWLTKFRAAQR